MLDTFKKKLAKMDVSVEVMRIIAAFMVIVIHTMLPNVVEGQPMPFRTYISCIIGDAVAIFWMIAGFFMFSPKKTYPQMLKRGLVGVALPTLMLFLAAFFLYDFVVNGTSLSESISHPLSDFASWRDSVINWVAAVPEAGVAWYMFVYMLVLMFWPFLSAFVEKYLRNSNRNQAAFMVLTFILLVWNYASDNHFLEFSHHALGGLVPASILVVWGWIIYSHRSVFKSRKLYGIAAIVLFFSANLIRAHVQVADFSQGVVGMTLMWYSPFSPICAGCIVIACISLVPSTATTTWRKILVAVGGTTLAVYLSHFMIRDFLKTRFGNPLYDALYANGQAMIVNQSLTDCIYLFLNTALIFAIGMLVAFMFKAGYSMIVYALSKIRDKFANGGSGLAADADGASSNSNG